MTRRVVAIHVALLALYVAALTQYLMTLNWEKPLYPLQTYIGFWPWLYETYGLAAVILLAGWMYWMYHTLPGARY